MKHLLHIFESAESASRGVAELFADLVSAKATENKDFNIAISGGGTPKQLFTILGEEYSNTISWQNVRFFWVDERCVEPTDAESNYGMTYDVLLQKSFINSENIFRIKGEDIPDFEAERYQKLLWKKLPVRDEFPVFDLILLGMGEDGHTASIFPNDLSLLDANASVAVNINPYSGQKRITLTGKTLNNAERMLFLLTGANKAEILKQIINKEEISKTYPAAYVHDYYGNMDFYIDKDAGKLLSLK